MVDSQHMQVKSLCSYCSRKVIKKVICINCGATFHESCSNRKICCNKQEFAPVKLSENSDVNNDEDLSTEIILESLKNENKLLTDLNEELKGINKLLKEKVHTLEESLNKLNKLNPGNAQTQQTLSEDNLITLKTYLTNEIKTFFDCYSSEQINRHSRDVINKSNSVNHAQKIPLINEHKNKQINIDVKNSKAAKNTNSTLRTLEDTQRKMMQDIVNLEKPISPQKTKSNPSSDHATSTEPSPRKPVTHDKYLMNNDGFTYPKYHNKKKNKNINVGRGPTSGNFQGMGKTNINKDKKIWLFISHVKDVTTENDIKTYIKEKTKSTNIAIKRLKMTNPTPNNQRFMVGVDPSLLDIVYDVNFWPDEVLFSRFNFRMGKRFLDNQQDNTQEQAASTNKNNPSGSPTPRIIATAPQSPQASPFFPTTQTLSQET